jgi:aspartyl-tRNA(Asn)/glutamyl-tRNA(Gln) amidotransferase subunit A
MSGHRRVAPREVRVTEGGRWRIGLVRQLSGPEVALDPRIRDALDGLREETSGVAVFAIDLAEVEQAVCVQLTIMLAEAAAIHHSQAQEHWDEYSEEVREMLRQGALISGVDLVEAIRLRERFAFSARKVMEVDGLDALCHPTVPCEAVPLTALHGTLSGGGTAMDSYVRQSFVASVAGLPALSVPIGQGMQGLPIAIEMIGRSGREEQLFALARYLQGVGLVSEPAFPKV